MEGLEEQLKLLKDKKRPIQNIWNVTGEKEQRAENN